MQFAGNSGCPSPPTTWILAGILVSLVTHKLAPCQQPCLPRQPQPGLLLAFLQANFLPPTNTVSPGASF